MSDSSFSDFVNNYLFDDKGIFSTDRWIGAERDLLLGNDPIDIKKGILLSELRCKILNLYEIDSVGQGVLLIRIKFENEGSELIVQNTFEITEGTIITIGDINAFININGVDLSNVALFQVHEMSVRKGIAVGPVFKVES
ncbi:MAG: hypothetical protein ABIM99_02350 [Candidatus Dojkabacteria bacterium]